MGTINKTRMFNTSPNAIEAVVSDIKETLRTEGYEVDALSLFSGGFDISITKGGVFKSIIGMKTALKVVIGLVSNGFVAEASVGIFGQQLIPSVISLLVFWPVIITQISGLVQQAQLGNHIFDIIQHSVNGSSIYSFNKENVDAKIFIAPIV